MQLSNNPSSFLIHGGTGVSLWFGAGKHLDLAPGQSLCKASIHGGTGVSLRFGAGKHLDLAPGKVYTKP